LRADAKQSIILKPRPAPFGQDSQRQLTDNMANKFWEWYQRNYRLNLIITTVLFLLQIFHLYWLFTDVVLFKLTGKSYFLLTPVWGQLSIFFDYSEIPALITTTILYVHYLRQKFTYKNLIYLIFLNIQWLHILWITDEFVVEEFTEGGIFHWANALAWVAILIDYLELPVIWDTLKETIKEVKKYFAEKRIRP
jgi:hypothetical protein